MATQTLKMQTETAPTTQTEIEPKPCCPKCGFAVEFDFAYVGGKGYRLHFYCQRPGCETSGHAVALEGGRN